MHRPVQSGARAFHLGRGGKQTARRQSFLSGPVVPSNGQYQPASSFGGHKRVLQVFGPHELFKESHRQPACRFAFQEKAEAAEAKVVAAKRKAWLQSGQHTCFEAHFTFEASCCRRPLPLPSLSGASKRNPKRSQRQMLSAAMLSSSTFSSNEPVFGAFGLCATAKMGCSGPGVTGCALERSPACLSFKSKRRVQQFNS